MDRQEFSCTRLDLELTAPKAQEEDGVQITSRGAMMVRQGRNDIGDALRAEQWSDGGLFLAEQRGTCDSRRHNGE